MILYLWWNILFFIVELYVPPIRIYIPSDARLSPLIVLYIRKCILIRKFFFQFYLCNHSSKMNTRSVMCNWFTEIFESVYWYRIFFRFVFPIIHQKWMTRPVKNLCQYTLANIYQTKGPQLCIPWYTDLYKWHGQFEALILQKLLSSRKT